MSLSVPSQVLHRILQKRLKEAVDLKLGKQQFGFQGEQIMCQPDRQSGTVARMELP